MAGDVKESSATETPPPMVDDPFPSIQATLTGILEEASGIGLEVFGPISSAAAAATGLSSQYSKLRIRNLILSTDIACIATLILGTRRYPFALTPGLEVIPFPFVIERATDISIEYSVAVTAHAYIVGRPE